jgi:hypothetical protein
MVVLKHHSDTSPEVRYFPRRQTIEVFTVDKYLPLGRSFQQTDQFQQRTLARTGMTCQKGKLALPQKKAELRQGFMAGGIAFTNLIKLNHLV